MYIYIYIYDFPVDIDTEKLSLSVAREGIRICWQLLHSHVLFFKCSHYSMRSGHRKPSLSVAREGTRICWQLSHSHAFVFKRSLYYVLALPPSAVRRRVGIVTARCVVPFQCQCKTNLLRSHFPARPVSYLCIHTLIYMCYLLLLCCS